MDTHVDGHTRAVPNDGSEGAALRPRRLAEVIGQHRAVEILSTAIGAATRRGGPLDHVLLQGPPGLGKTSLAAVIANETGGRFRPMSGPLLQRAVDMAAMLSSIEPNDVVFIDEIHRAHPAAMEMTYTAMEDFRLDMTIGSGLQARSVSLPLSRFTLIGATTRAGQLPKPLRDRFGIDLSLELYGLDDMVRILNRSATLLGLTIREDAALACARRCRGTPRVANSLLRRLRDIAENRGTSIIDIAIAHEGFELLGVDERGLEARERAYLSCLAGRFGGGPVGIDSLAAAMGLEAITLEEDVEPWLVHAGFVERTSRGRVLGAGAANATPSSGNRQPGLFDQT